MKNISSSTQLVHSINTFTSTHTLTNKVIMIRGQQTSSTLSGFDALNYNGKEAYNFKFYFVLKYEREYKPNKLEKRHRENNNTGQEKVKNRATPKFKRASVEQTTSSYE